MAHGTDLDGRTLLQTALSGRPGGSYGSGVADNALEAAAGSASAAPRVYWDAGLNAPLHPAARESLVAALDDGWADPARSHTPGRRARMLLDGAREACAAGLGARTEEVSFYPSHASALHAAVLGTLAGRVRVGAVLVHSAVEHSGVLAAAAWHMARGGRCIEIGVDHVGRVDVDAFAAAVAQPGVAVAALQSANGEVGTVQPVEEVQSACRAAGVPLVVDVGAAAGHVTLPAATDLLVADPGAWGGGPGVGVLVVRAGTRWQEPGPVLPGVSGSSGHGAAGAAVPAVLAAAVSLQHVLADRDPADARRRSAVARLRRSVPSVVHDVEVVGDGVNRLPHVLTFSCLFADGEALLDGLDREGFAVGSGSACTSDTLHPSHVLAAMGVLTHGNVRIALPSTTPAAEIDSQVDRFLDLLPRVVERVRDQMGTADL